MNKKYRIIIWGAGNIGREALQHVSDWVEVLGFMDNNASIKEFGGLKRLEMEELRKKDRYDFVVICSVFFKEIYRQLVGGGVKPEKILYDPMLRSRHYEVWQLDLFKRKWQEFLEREKRPEIMVSGISYHRNGIDAQTLTEGTGKEAFNFANKGQDIFYDYQIAKLLEERNDLDFVTHYVIGLCYYSFELDLSKTLNGWEIIRYYPYIRDPHNLMENSEFGKFVEKTEQYFQSIRIYYELFHKRYPYTLNEEDGAETARRDFAKSHPVTVWENKELFRQFLALLEKKKIKPVVVIMPAMKSYVEACPADFKGRFYDALEACLDGRDIQILDYFGSYYGEPEDYYHISHFNLDGARKFTGKLVKDIIW